MSPITHGLVGWLAGAPFPIKRRGRALVTLAGLAPDLDAFGLPFELLTRGREKPLLWWSEFHHVLGHNFLFAVVVTVGAALLARTHRALVAMLAFASFHLHLVGDLVGAGGPEGERWPIHYLWPFDDRVQLSWSGQWRLDAWPNVAITGAAIFLCFVFARARGISPVELFSVRANAALVETLRRRFGA